MRVWLPLLAAVVVQAGCSASNQSLLLYRIPYANGTQVFVSRDHLTHTPPDRLDLVGVNGVGPYRVVAAQTGIIRFIVDHHTANCCGGSCANNYVWIEHLGGEWTKYSHIAPQSASVDAGLSVGDLVLAGQFLGYESNVGRACGTHLHCEVGRPDDPANPLQPGNGGFIAGTNRVMRFCGVQPRILEAGTTVTAVPCPNLLDCIQSIVSPGTEQSCVPGYGGNPCVQSLHPASLGSTYIRGQDFASSSVELDLEWCANGDCHPEAMTGRAVLVVVWFDEDVLPNEPPAEFIANCENRRIRETLHNVDRIAIGPALNLGPENLACSGNHLLHSGFARWEICEISPLFAEM